MNKAHDILVKCSRCRHHLNKTLCAMRWIALLAGKHDVARAIEKDMENVDEKL